jgi:hypothetical protein
MCVSKREFQYINQETQVALFSDCIGNCSSVLNIRWNIYQGSMNASSDTVEWTRFDQMTFYENVWFFGKCISYSSSFLVITSGMNTCNFTATNALFLENRHIIYWRFEVIYSFVSDTSTSALHFEVNKPPENGSCLVSPRNGTTSTLFNISCLGWFDNDEIKDYSFYGEYFRLHMPSVL